MKESKLSTPVNKGNENSEGLAALAKPIFLAWEGLRILYILLLGALTMVLAWPTITTGRTIAMIVEGAIVANICFFAGPIVETYITWLGQKGSWIRWTLFLAGTLFTALLAILVFSAMSSNVVPNQN